MSKTLVLTEKPSVARDIARVLNCNKKGNGFIEGSKYIITWALGHLVTLAEPEAYSDRYKNWNLEDLPMLPKKMELVVIKNTAKQFNAVKTLMRRGDASELVIATDAGREGELVARWIIEKVNFKKPIKRLWISSQTDKAIKEGFAKLKSGKEYVNLYKSAQCRAEADWLVGLNVTRALTVKHNAQLSAGRVQTPTLAMIVQREEEIRKFKPKSYWMVDAKAQGFTLRWRDKVSGQNRIFDKVRADGIVAKVNGNAAEVLEVSKTAKQELPPLAYDLTELQRDANRRYGYSAKKTLNIMQKLYEAHKLVTYPRTDSRYITNDMISTLKDRLKSIAIGPYKEMTQKVLREKLNVTKRLVNDSKVTDHHAIIPTEQFVDLSKLNSEERNIYDLIVKRFLAVLNPSFEYEQTTVKVSVSGEFFYAKGKITKQAGWKAVYNGYDDLDDENDDEDRDQQLPQLKKGQKINIASIKQVEGKTKPPARYNEATILSAMEHPGKFIDDKKLREVVEESSGLGTPATRADIIEKLFQSFYLERRGKDIFPTSKGIQLVELVPEDLREAELTAKWEQELQMIGRGKANADAFIKNIRDYASKLVSNVISSDSQYKHDNLTRERCPECNKFLLDVQGKKGKMRICQDRDCRYRKTISQQSNARCPECHKKMEIRGEGENKTFYCLCGYREKLETFKKRKGQKVDKREVKKFLNKQQPEEQINSALADALVKWNK